MLFSKNEIIGSVLIAAGAIVGIVCLGYATRTPPQQTTLPTGGQSMLPTTTITIGTERLTVEIASTPEEQQDGLSKRSSLADGSGMLFVFDPPSAEGFWMKDMLFSLDIIWADASGTITTINQNLSPDTYPNVYRPATASKYVLEVPAGYTTKKGIAVGQKIVVQ